MKTKVYSTAEMEVLPQVRQQHMTDRVRQALGEWGHAGAVGPGLSMYWARRVATKALGSRLLKMDQAINPSYMFFEKYHVQKKTKLPLSDYRSLIITKNEIFTLLLF